MRKIIDPEILKFVKDCIEHRKNKMSDGLWDGFEMLDEYNEIRPNLFLGGHPAEINNFKYVFALNGRPTYFVANGKTVICSPFNDADFMPDEEMLYEMAEMVLHYSKKAPTLVHCAAGINRSSLVLCLALILDGMTAPDAIALIREKRSKSCLSNVTFERWLLDQKIDDEEST